MSKKYVYLAGPVKYEEDGGTGWRLDVYKYSKDRGWIFLAVFDPTEWFTYSQDDEYHLSDRQIREYYFQAIKRSFLVLVNLSGTDKSIGTGMEIQYVVDHDVPVIGFGTEGIYPWIADSCTVCFNTLDEALRYIEIYYDTVF